MALVTGYPIIYAFWLSLNMRSLSAPGERSFVGLSNYVTVLSDGYWWTAFGVTRSSPWSPWRSNWCWAWRWRW